MRFLPLLGKPLKSDEIADLLELWDADVIYDFDRTHENIPDEYWAGLRELGVQLLFDDSQRLKVIFLYTLEGDGFSPVDLSDSDIQTFRSPAEVAAYAARAGIATSEGQASLLGPISDWIKLEWSTHSVHYEFRGGELCLVTVAEA